MNDRLAQTTADTSSAGRPSVTRPRGAVAGPVAVVRFATEVLVLIAVSAWALRTPYSAPVRWFIALLAAGGVAAVWGRFVAPRSPTRLADPARLTVEVAVFAVGGAASAALTSPSVGLGFLATAVGAALAVRWVDR